MGNSFKLQKSSGTKEDKKKNIVSAGVFLTIIGFALLLFGFGGYGLAGGAIALGLILAIGGQFADFS